MTEPTREHGHPGDRRFTINTFPYMQSRKALDCIRHLANEGYSQFELMAYPGHVWPSDTPAADIRAIRQFCQANSLRIVSLNVPNIDTNVAGASPEIRNYTLELFSGLIRFSGELAAESIILGTGRPNALLPLPIQQAKDHLGHALSHLFPIASRSNVSILIENVPFCFLRDAASIAQMLDEHGNPDIGIIYDVANGHFIGEDIPAALRQVKSRLRLLHLSDTTRANWLHAPIGTGDVPFRDLPAVLREIAYQGPMVLEILSEQPEAALRDSAAQLSRLGFSRTLDAVFDHLRLLANPEPIHLGGIAPQRDSHGTLPMQPTQTTSTPLQDDSGTEPTQVLAQFAAGLSLDRIPEKVVLHGKNLLLDALACAVAGHAGEEMPQITAFATALSPGAAFSIIAGDRHSLVGATLVNAFLITAVTMCDAHRPTQTHITPEVVPPALAIAERDNASGGELLAALIAGFEVTTRIGIGLDFNAFRERGFHGPGVLGPFGAASAVGRLRKFDQDTMARAFGLSGSQSAGTFAAWGTPTVKFHQCRGALSGLMAALLAEQEFVATRRFLTAGDGGLYKAYCGGGDPSRVVADLGQRWELENIAVRAWPSAAPLQGLITATIDLISHHAFAPEDVEKVDVRMSQFAFDLHGNFAAYNGKFEAMLSSHYVVAAILHDRDLTLDQFAPERYNAPPLRDFIARRISVAIDGKLKGPQAKVDIRLRDGRTCSTSCTYPLGAPENPMSSAQVERKFRHYAGPHLRPKQIDEVVEIVFGLERIASARTLLDALRRG